MRLALVRRLLGTWALPGYVVVALAIMSWWHGTPAHAEPPACPAEVVKCCEVGVGVASQASPPQLFRFGLQIWPEDVAEASDRLHALQPAAVRYSGGPSWRRAPRLDRDADYGAVQRYVADAFERDNERFQKQAASLSRFFEASAAEVYFAIWEPPMTNREPEASDKRTLPESAVGVTAMFTSLCWMNCAAGGIRCTPSSSRTSRTATGTFAFRRHAIWHSSPKCAAWQLRTAYLCRGSQVLPSAASPRSAHI